MGRARESIREIKSAHIPEFRIAYQPIVNVRTQQIVAYEALTRGCDGRTFPELVSTMDAATIRKFHRVTARESIRKAKELGLLETGASLCINMQPDLSEFAVTGEYILEIATSYGVPAAKILLELTEDHELTAGEMRTLVEQNQSAGFATGVDDFGSGYSGLTMLVECRPEVLKLDRALVRGIDHCETRTRVVEAFAQMSHSLDMIVVAEGVETVEECGRLQELGVDLMQGYLFSYPVVNELPSRGVWGVLHGPQDTGETLNHREAGSYWKPRRAVEALTLRAECA